MIIFKKQGLSKSFFFTAPPCRLRNLDKEPVPRRELLPEIWVGKKNSFGFFYNIWWKNPNELSFFFFSNELSDQPNIFRDYELDVVSEALRDQNLLWVPLSLPGPAHICLGKYLPFCLQINCLLPSSSPKHYLQHPFSSWAEDTKKGEGFNPFGKWLNFPESLSRIIKLF